MLFVNLYSTCKCVAGLSLPVQASGGTQLTSGGVQHKLVPSHPRGKVIGQLAIHSFEVKKSN